jgi:photosystem II stability/assembly factor-like uncharacterized protein
LIVGCALSICGCPNAAEKNTAATSASSAALASAAPSAPAASVPSWHWMNPQPQGNQLLAIATDEACGVVAVGDAGTVMQSKDDGLTWTTRQAADRHRFKSAALSGTDLYVVGDSSDDAVVLKFASCGQADPITMRKLDPKTDGSANAVAVDRDGRVFVSTVLHAEGKILCTKSKTEALAVCDDLPKQPFYSMFVDANGRVLVAGGYQGTDGGIVRASTDHGATWRTIAKHLGTIAYGIFGDASGAHIIVTSSGESHASSDGGKTWTTAPAAMMGGGSMMLGTGDAPYVPNDFDSFVFGADNGTFFVTSGGVARGENFVVKAAVPLTSTDRSTGFEAAVTTGNGHWIGVGDSGRITRSIDDGKTWKLISSDALPEGEAFENIRADAQSIFVLRRARLLRSDDAGKTFQDLGVEDGPDSTISARDLPSMAIDDKVLLIPRPKKNAIARSTDRGKTFTEIPIALAPKQNVLHVWNAGSGVFYGTGASGALFQSTDEGATFNALKLDTRQDLEAGVARGHDVFVVGTASGSSGGFFHSADDGKTWTSTGLDFDPFGIATSGSDLFVVSRYGIVVRSSDQGASWKKTVDLDCGDVSGLVAQDAHVFIACSGGNLFTSINRGATFEKESIPADVELLFSDGHAGLLAASSRGRSQLLHYF